jgi:hypothetical protein
MIIFHVAMFWGGEPLRLLSAHGQARHGALNPLQVMKVSIIRIERQLNLYKLQLSKGKR